MKKSLGNIMNRDKALRKYGKDVKFGLKFSMVLRAKRVLYVLMVLIKIEGVNGEDELTSQVQ